MESRGSISRSLKNGTNHTQDRINGLSDISYVKCLVDSHLFEPTLSSSIRK